MAAENGLSRRDFLAALAAAGIASLGGHVAWPRLVAGGLGPLEHRVRSELGVFTDWLERERARGFVGEVNWPNMIGRTDTVGYDDSAQWNALGEKWYRWADAAGLWVTMHCVDEYQRWGGFWLTAYTSVGDGETRPISRPMPQAAVYERHPATSRYRRGMQLSCGERWKEGWSNKNPGVYGRDYWYASRETLDYLRSRGTDIVRVPFRWERIQPVLGGALDREELDKLKACVARAGAAGLKVILDLHNFGVYCAGHRGRASKLPLGSSGLPVARLVDVWRKLSYAFKADPAVVAYDLMNEPYIDEGIPASGYPSPQKAWEHTTRRVVEAIRDRGDGKLLMIPGYAHIYRWAEKHPRRWISDAAGNHMYTAHHYFDGYRGPNTGGGNYRYSYNEEVVYSRRHGY